MSFWQSLKPDPKNLRSDVVSGFATGLFSVPEGMAYAQLAGVNPVYGLYSGMVATLVSALTTGTILMISTAMPNPDGSRSNQSRDFIGEGLGNVFGSFFQSMSTGGSLSRTGISVGAGAKSR